MSDLDYTFAVARIRVKENSLLTDMDISQMISMQDDKAVLSYLKDRGWGDTDTETAEEVLASDEKKTLQLMKELKIEQSAFDLLSYPNLYHNLKAAIKEVCTSDQNPGAFYDMERYGRKEMLQIVSERDWHALPEHMRACAERAMDVMLKARDGQMCDVYIDRACLDAMKAAGRKSKNELLRNYIESTVAVADIKTAVRALKTGKNRAFLNEALAAADTLDAGRLAVAASESEEALHAYLESHGYSEASEALKESPSAFERWCDNRLIDTIRPEKRNPFSMGPVIAYYLARQNEIRTVRILLTAKANGFSEEETREMVRKMYV